MAGLLYANDDPERARLTLRSAFDAGDPASHPFTQKYLSALRVLVPIAEGVTGRSTDGRLPCCHEPVGK